MLGAQQTQTIARGPMASEATPLLRSNVAVAESQSDKPSWKGWYRLEDRETRRERLRGLILDAHRTAGLNSEEVRVRISAFIWHNTKAVILSGTQSIEVYPRTCVLTKRRLFRQCRILPPVPPLGIVSSSLKWDPATVFILNFYAIIPLTSLVSFATRDEFVGRLLHALLSNVAEIVV
ncbi:Ca2+:H+ antiporter [Apiospora kogelbergensis]|uniref:Ca2+:H+ antiporter n=1 Tax=Apiospora kogelbergensis TaxID=1337665 RepID=UPI00312F6D28